MRSKLCLWIRAARKGESGRGMRSGLVVVVVIEGGGGSDDGGGGSSMVDPSSSA